jgi:uncharacterized protein (TIGR03437 family)
VTVQAQIFPTKAVPYATYTTSLKTNPNATLDLPAPTGTVTIYDGASVAGATTLSGSPLLTIALGALSAGTHVLTASYSGDSNYAPISFGNYNLTIGAGSPAGPSITSGGIVNAASFNGGTLPAGIAPGSLFTIFGSGLGPAAPVKASGYPLQTSLGGASVRIVQNGKTYDAWLSYASAEQINAVLPSTIQPGAALATVTYNQAASLPAPIWVAPASVGIFQGPDGSAVAQNVNSPTDYPLNQPATPAKPGQIVLLWATGMGALAAPDNAPPGSAASDMTGVPVTIAVGGISAARLYAGRQSQFAGVDNVYFTVPAGVPSGCKVPVTVVAGGIPAITVNLAITADGSPCK